MRNLGRHIVVHGPSGAGKTTFSRELGARLGLPVIELDGIFHSRPGWNDLSREEYRAAVSEVLEANPDGWVIDGNYFSMVGDLVHARAETAIWLRLPFRMVYPRLVRRSLRRLRTRELLWGVNRESFRLTFMSRDSILLWGITHWRAHRRNTRAALRAAKANGVRVIVVRRPAEATALLNRIPQHIEAAAAGT